MASHRHPNPRAASELYRYSGVGLQFAATIGVFAYGGYWLDGRLGARPWCLLAGVFLGFALGLISLVSRLAPRRTKNDPVTKPREPLE